MSDSGKNVLVVGGARGIGRVAVDRLIAEGYRPLVVDRDAQELATCQGAWGGTARTSRMDLTQRDDMLQTLGWVKGEVGRLDAVIITAFLWNLFTLQQRPAWNSSLNL